MARQSTSTPREALGRLFAITLRAGSTAAVRAFISKGVSLNARDAGGQTPLMIAASRGHLECARLLIDADCDLEAVDDMGRNALEHARDAGCLELISLLSADYGPHFHQASEAPHLNLPPDSINRSPGAVTADLEASADTGEDVDPHHAAHPIEYAPLFRDTAVLDALQANHISGGRSTAPDPFTVTDAGMIAGSSGKQLDCVKLDQLRRDAPPEAEPAKLMEPRWSPRVGTMPNNYATTADRAPSDQDTGSSDSNIAAVPACSEPASPMFVPALRSERRLDNDQLLSTDDWIEEAVVDPPVQSASTLIEAAGIQHEISSCRRVSLGDDWSGTDLELPIHRPASADEPLPESLLKEARRLITRAFFLGSLPSVAFGDPSTEADAEDFRQILGQIADDAGLIRSSADDPWGVVAPEGHCDDLAVQSEADDWLEEFEAALVEARRPPRGMQSIDAIARLTREQEDDLFFVSRQAVAEAALQLARSAEAIDFILATDAAVAAGALAFEFVSRLELEATDESDPEYENALFPDEDPRSAATSHLPARYENAINVVRQVRDSMAGAAAGPAQLRGCATAIQQMALSPDYLTYLAIELSDREAAVDAVCAVRSAVRVVKVASDRLAAAHLPHVREITRYYRDRGVDEDDLIQEGTIGLLRAIELFEPARGFRFWTYAQLWVRQSMGRAVADKGRTIRVPVHVLERYRRVTAKATEIERETGFEPTATDLALALELSEDEIRKLLHLGQDRVVFEGDLYPALEDCEGSQSFGRSLDEVVTAHELHQAVRDAMLQLDPRAERILRMRFGIGLPTGHTLEEVGERFGVTRERIRQIEAKALARLFRPQGGRMLRHFRRL